MRYTFNEEPPSFPKQEHNKTAFNLVDLCLEEVWETSAPLPIYLPRNLTLPASILAF